MGAAVDIRPVVCTSARVLGRLLLAPFVMTLILLEPIVSFICCFMMLGGMFAAVLFEISAVGSRFPFLLIFGISLSFGVFLMIYQALMMLLVRD